jgi:hypothetical protein
MDGKPTVPKFVTFGSPASPERLSMPDMTNTFLLVAIAGGILIVYALSRVISLQRRIKDLEARPPMDDIVMRSIIRQEVSALVNHEPPKTIDATNAEYVAPVEVKQEVPIANLFRSKLEEASKYERPEPKAEPKVEAEPEQETDTYEEEEEERAPSPPKKVSKRKSKAKKTEVDLSSE